MVYAGIKKPSGSLAYYKQVTSWAVYYSCISIGNPSGSWKKVIFSPVNVSVLTGSQEIPFPSSSATVSSTLSTLNARWRKPQASGFETRAPVIPLGSVVLPDDREAEEVMVEMERSFLIRAYNGDVVDCVHNHANPLISVSNAAIDSIISSKDGLSP